MEITKELVLEALSTVNDPDLHKDLVSLNMIEDVKVDGKKISFTVVLTTPACPLKEVMRNDCKKALETKFGSGLEVHIEFDSAVTTSRLKGTNLLPGVKNIIAVASGKGGVGKSTVTSNLAVALAKTGAKVGIIDADIFGPSIPTMFGCESERPGVSPRDGKNYIQPIENYGVKLISIGFLTSATDSMIWRGPMASSALKQFISDADWGDLDYMLIDLPPGTSDIHLTLVQTLPVTGAIIVTTPQKVAVADAVRGIGMFKQTNIDVPILGVVENMAYFTPSELPDNKYYIFGTGGGKDLAKQFETEFLGEIPLVQGIRESGDSGYPSALKDGPTAVAFKSLAESMAQEVAKRNASKPTTKIVEVSNEAACQVR
ncbi:MAG: Mrp/NBP35 family ATP-binding protein [Cyclobacteriaceae bacterium]|nr:Mrp/NBP35 family ATP-binding protein [Cyclobacteriaceae bacterium]